jgi:hypothetical protein
VVVSRYSRLRLLAASVAQRAERRLSAEVAGAMWFLVEAM